MVAAGGSAARQLVAGRGDQFFGDRPVFHGLANARAGTQRTSSAVLLKNMSWSLASQKPKPPSSTVARIRVRGPRRSFAQRLSDESQLKAKIRVADPVANAVVVRVATFTTSGSTVPLRAGSQYLGVRCRVDGGHQGLTRRWTRPWPLICYNISARVPTSGAEDLSVRGSTPPVRSDL